jgi:hypothetical protein
MAAGFEQVESANDVGLDKIARTGDGTIHMRLGGEVKNVGDCVLFKHPEHCRFVTQIDFFEPVLRMTFDRLEIRLMPGVGQTVQINQALNLRPLDDVMDEVRTDESGAPGDQEIQTSPPAVVVAMFLLCWFLP